jgi:heptosyltransferase III
MDSFIIIHTGGLGDFLQIFPVLAALRSRCPASRVTLVGHPERAALALAGGLVDEVLDFETCGLHRLFAPDAREADVPAGLRRARTILNFIPAPELSANLARLTSAWTIDAVSFPAPGACRHAAAQFVYDQVAEPLGLPPRAALPELRLPPDCPARTALAARFPEAARALAIHPGSGSPTKNWPLERFVEVSRLQAARGAPTLWLLGPAELEQPAFAPLARADQALALAPLGDVAALLSLVRGYLGNDSGVTHLAAALGRPTVALFGPTDRAVWAPRGPHVRVIACAGGLADLWPTQVAEAIDMLL